MTTYNNKSTDTLDNEVKEKPYRNRNKTIHKLIFRPIMNTLRKIKKSIPIRRNSRVHGESQLSLVSNKQNPLQKNGGKTSTRKNRKLKSKQ